MSAPAGPAERLHVGPCAGCGKRRYTSRVIARRAARSLYPGARMRAYQCGQWWHIRPGRP